ncbi:uncharacterized protein TRIADDRAFT_25870 [Trichoplax adhaerens]|uniref:WD repeat-containing protein 17 n=1 Tax=Trichoplax adhaerens TaxID=10228 RepID=B3RYL8_TRIAD|nr:hypothetical protein TRIADDRAFT_25870 [Trichoplax adhaerens]EDV25063.1 hypothetical protein TRIADDRAFT_25870 [Trichoplax adhaerens]|eukprot:XP_002112953.1 hypothetical protein TRIADDRAFT_25870 [Trichoplax adhaerens]
MARQVGLLAAGCQPWNRDVCSASGNRFAYCATLAIYIYELNQQYNEYMLCSIMSEHKKTITSIAWNPRDPDIIASCSTDRTLYIWNVASKSIVANVELKGSALPAVIAWNPHDKNIVTIALNSGSFMRWDCSCPSNYPVIFNKDSNFVSRITHFRWHNHLKNTLAFGHFNGSLSFFYQSRKCQKNCLMPESTQESAENMVISVEWDVLSDDYLLVANAITGARLIDSRSLTVLMQFKLPSSSAHIHTLAWLKNAPGMFVTGDTESGVMRIWNVSRQSPIENITVKITVGFHELSVLDTPYQEKQEEAPSSPTKSNGSVALPPARIVCTFADGGVGLYSLQQRRWEFLRDLGHIETIFDCKFKPTNPSLLATASFDGTIKVWDINTMTAKYASPGNKGIIYSVSWAPADLNCLAASTAKGGAFIWDVDKVKVIRRFTEHGKNAVYCVSWNQKDSRKIATCGADGNCIIHHADGQIIAKFKHPGFVFGCDWSPTNKDMIATGCDDKRIRVFILTTNSDTPLKTFSGHTAKVFHVRWSPLREGLLCSGSDDGTVRIWNYTQDSCVIALKGHTAPVRGLIWHPEIPFLLISGSWDSTIRIWDIRDGACIETILDHGADVYGLSIHPLRPFTLASCSRDSTLRIWHLSSFSSRIYTSLLAKRPWNEILGTADDAMVAEHEIILCGPISRLLRANFGNDTNVQDMKLRSFSEFLLPPIGVNNCWTLLDVILKDNDSLLPTDYSEGIMHVKHISKYKISQAQELESTKMSKFSGGIGNTSKEEKLRKAAALYLQLGHTQKYCELLIEIGEWDKALAVAPSVSLTFWKNLAERHAKYLASEDSEDCVPYFIATRNYENLITLLKSKARLHEAVLIAQIAQADPVNYDESAIATAAKHLPSLKTKSSPFKKLLDDTVNLLANRYFTSGRPVMAANCHLSNDQYDLAMSRLIMGNELELAVSIGIVLKERCSYECFEIAARLLARKCEKLKKCFNICLHRDLAIQMLNQLTNSKPWLVMTCARYSNNAENINALHKMAGLSDIEYYDKKSKNENSPLIERLENCILSSNPEDALDIGINAMKGMMSKPKWNLNEVFEIIQYLSCIRPEKLQDSSCSRQRSELLALASIVGALMCVRMSYDSLVRPLFLNAKSLMQREDLELPLNITQINAYILAWQARTLSPNSNIYPLGELTSESLRGPVICSGSSYPSHSDVKFCSVTDTRIHGSAFFLENGQSCMALNNAIMWALANPFSPLNSGALINPF